LFGDGAKGVCGDEVYCEREGGDGVVTEREWIDGGDGVLFHDGVEGACIDAGDGVVCRISFALLIVYSSLLLLRSVSARSSILLSSYLLGISSTCAGR